VKVNELKPHRLEEGFLDNFISKVKDMAGGDGPTGIVRTLMGQAPNLNKLADTIANNTRSRVLTRLGNQINAIKNGSAPTPIGTIFQQALAVAGEVANGEGDVKFNPAQVKATIANKSNELLKIVLNGDAASDDNIKQIYQAIQSGSADLTFANDINDTLKTVGMIVASALVYISTQAQDNPAGAFKIDPAIAGKFKTEGETIINSLVNPTSPMLRALKPTADYKDNLENLIADVVNYAREYTDKSADEIKNAAVNPDAVSLPEVETALSGHDISVDETTVKTVADALHKQINQLMKDYLTSAAKEVEETGAGNSSFEQLVKPWGVRIFNAMDNLKFGKQQQKQKPKPGAPEPAPTTPAPEETTEIKNLEASHDAGVDAVRQALEDKPGLKPDDMKRIYDTARADYDAAHPV
jgi:hypothetical protein